MKTIQSIKIMMTILITACIALAGACGEYNPNSQNTQAIIGDSQQSECLQATDYDALDEVEIQAQGDSITIVDHYAEFNCCLDVWMEVSLDGQNIVVVEVEDPDDSMACDCMCPYELSIEVSNLTEGTYNVSVYRGAVDPQTLIHEESVCLGCSLPECQAPIDCLDHTWGFYCVGAWGCNEGICEEICDAESCGDGECDAELGEDRQSCMLDCPNVTTECQTPIDCLDHTWGFYCVGAWGCNEGICEEICDAESCGDGECDAEAGEDEQSCMLDCRAVTQVPVLESFSASCQECGAEECYEPSTPHGESRLEIEVELDTETNLFRLHAIHDVLCIDVGILGAELFIEGSTLIVVETFDHDNPVDCYCTQRADILIADLAAGTYQLQIRDKEDNRLLIEERVTLRH